jgi:hypothetical protein
LIPQLRSNADIMIMACVYYDNIQPKNENFPCWQAIVIEKAIVRCKAHASLDLNLVSNIDLSYS